MVPIPSQGGGRDNRWNYQPATRVFTRQWTRAYYDMWSRDGIMVPVEWWCFDVRVTYQGVEEFWMWRYLDEPDFSIATGSA